MYKNNGDMFSTFTTLFRGLLYKHKSSKLKKARGSQSRFMIKEQVKL